MGKKTKNREINFLELIPVRSTKIDWEVDENGLVKLIIWRNTILDKVVRKLFNTPKRTVIDLDEQGSNVWKNIDGKRSVGELIELQRDKFGKSAEPALERLITFIRILKNNEFITFKENKVML